MNSKKKIVMVSLILLGMEGAFAEEKIAVGFQSVGLVAHGLSAKYELTDKFKVQGILAFLGDVNTYSLRGLYQYNNDKKMNLYGYASLGKWSVENETVEYRGYSTSTNNDESVMGYGIGTGVEYDLRSLNANFIPLFVNVELGLEIVNFDTYNYSAVGVSAGVHYKF